MPTLFAEHFLTRALDPATALPEPIYNEERGINMNERGEPFVTSIRAGETHTLTEVRAEQSDRDRPDDDRLAALDTITKIAREGSDVSGEAWLGTETRQVPGEREDRACVDPELGTRTAIPREQDDWNRADAWKARYRPSLLGSGVPAPSLDTYTLVRGEGRDRAASLLDGDRHRVA